MQRRASMTLDTRAIRTYVVCEAFSGPCEVVQAL